MVNTRYQLFMLINSESALGHPFIGISTTTERVLFISDDHIDISTLHKNDHPSFNEDYVATSRFVDVDFEALDNLIEKYIGQRNYSLIVHFNEKKECTLAYRTTKDNVYEEDDIDIDFPNEKGAALASEIHARMEVIKREVFLLD